MKRCRELGLLCWLYDDDKFLSGSAGGIVTKNYPEYRGRFLLLPEQIRPGEDGKLHVGEMAYDAVVVPDMLTVRSSTLQALEAFHKQGGTVIFAGSIPEFVDALASDRCVQFANRGIVTDDLITALAPFREVTVTLNGESADKLLHQLRQIDDDRWLFLCHARRKTENVLVEERYTVRVRGHWQVELYDTQSGEIHPVLCAWQGNETVFSCSLFGEDSVLYRLSQAEAQTDFSEPRPEEYVPVAQLTHIDRWEREEKNVLLLDKAAWRLEDGALHETEEILRADNHIREALGYPIRRERISQPYHLPDTPPHTVTLYYAFQSNFSGPH